MALIFFGQIWQRLIFERSVYSGPCCQGLHVDSLFDASYKRLSILVIYKVFRGELIEL